jgi:hypothetical protein
MCRKSDANGRFLAAPGCAVAIWTNRTLGTVGEREVRRVLRNQIGGWCAEVVVAYRTRIEVFDYHPSVALLRLLRNGGTDIADYVIAES